MADPDAVGDEERMTNREDTICTVRQIDMTTEEIEELLKEVEIERTRRFLEQDDRPKVIRKNDLKKYKALIIEHRYYPELYESYLPIGIGIMRIAIDEEKETMTGLRIMKCCGKYEVMEKTYYLDNYRKNWRAWTRMPRQKMAWK